MDNHMEELILQALCDHEKIRDRNEVYLDEDIFIADRLFDAGYRLDPYPNGKSKDELIKINEGLEADLARARFFLYTRLGGIPEIDAFLAETNRVKS